MSESKKKPPKPPEPTQTKQVERWGELTTWLDDVDQLLSEHDDTAKEIRDA